MFRRVPLRVFAVLTALVAPFALGAGHDITTPTYGPTLNTVYSPRIASNGQGFLTVWIESPNRLRGSLADVSGRVLTPVSFPVLGLTDPYLEDVQIAAVGNGYALVFATYQGVRLARLSGTGELQSVSDLAVPRNAFSGTIRIASNGSAILLVVPTGNSFPAAQDVAFLANLDGTVQWSTQLGPSGFRSAAVATRSGWTVAAISGTSVVTYQLGTDGTLRSKSLLSTVTDPAGLAVATQGDDVAVVWGAFAAGAAQVTVLSDAGAIKSSRDIPIGSSRLGRSVDVAPAPNGYAAALATCADTTSNACVTSLFRLDATGRMLDPAPLRASSHAPAVIASNGNSAVVATGSSTIEGAAINLLTSDVATTTLSISSAIQRYPSAASNGFDFLASFSEATHGREPVRAARFTRDGAPLDGPGVALGSETGTALSDTAYGGSTYIVVWSDRNTMYLRRLDSAGNVIDLNPIALGSSSGDSSPAVAWNGSSFLAVWTNNGAIYGAMVPERGAPATPFVVAGGGIFLDPDVASDGQQFLVAWTTYTFGPLICTCGPSPRDIRVTGVKADGTVFEGAPPVVGPIGISHLAASGSEYLIVIDGAPRLAVFAHTDGGVVRFDPPRVIRPESNFYSPATAVTWDGRDYVLAWRFRSVATYFLASARLSRTGELFDRRAVRTPAPGVSGELAPRDPALAANALGDVAVVTTEESRLRAYFVSEMPAVPALAERPANVQASLAGRTLSVTWDAVPGDVTGYSVELGRPGTVYGPAQVPAPLHAFTARLTAPDPLPVWVRVRTSNAGGLSEPSDWVLINVLNRERAARH